MPASSEVWLLLATGWRWVQPLSGSCTRHLNLPMVPACQFLLRWCEYQNVAIDRNLDGPLMVPAQIADLPCVCSRHHSDYKIIFLASSYQNRCFNLSEIRQTPTVLLYPLQVFGKKFNGLICNMISANCCQTYPTRWRIAADFQFQDPFSKIVHLFIATTLRQGWATAKRNHQTICQPLEPFSTACLNQV